MNFNKTDMIFQGNGCPYQNASQGPAKRLLFVCSAGLLRSPTAAVIAAKEGFNTRSCGSHVNLALIPISANLIKWADWIIFMNSSNCDALKLHVPVEFKELWEIVEKKAIVWRIEDCYNYMDESLVWKIEREMQRTFHLVKE